MGRDEAASHAKRLQKEDATFDIYVVDMYKWLLIPPDNLQIEDAHYADEKLEELMAVKTPGTDTYFKSGDENSQFYTKPDEAPVSHPGEVLDRLQKEKPDANMEDLVKEADEIVAQEVKERQEKREADAKEALEKEAKQRGFNSVEVMQKFDDEKARAELQAAEEEAKKAQVELSEQAQIKEDDGKDEE